MSVPVVSAPSVVPTDTLAVPSPRASDESATFAAAHSLILDLLRWIAREPRSYTEAMEAWRSSCPRLSIWDDAIGDGLIALAPAPGVRLMDVPVHLTPRGCALLDGA